MPAPPVGVIGDRVAAAGTWSGSPAGLQQGLRELGLAVVAVDAGLPRLAGAACRAWLRASGRTSPVWDRTPEALRAAELWGRVRSRSGRARGVRRWVQIGSEVGAPLAPGSYVTFDDMTVAQARRLPNPYFDRLDDRSLDGWEATQRRLLASARAACVASHWAARSMVEDYGLDPDRVRIVGIGANLEPERRDRAWERPRFLFVGLDWERKNGPGVVEAFRRLRAEQPEARLDVVGDHPRLEGPGVVGHGPLDRLVPEERSRLLGLFTGATCLVVPSVSEPFGIVYLEAARAGVASIGTTVGGAGEPIGDTGILVDPSDPAVLFDAMRTMADPAEARTRGERAYERAGLFTWKRVAARTARALGVPLPGPPEPFLDEVPGFSPP